MTVYTIDLANKISSIKTHLTTAGRLGTVHYETANELIFNLVGVPGVVRISLVTNLFNMYHGDSWTAGTTLVNSKGVSLPRTQTQVSAGIIVTPNLVAFGLRNISDVYSTIFTKTDSATPKDIILSFSSYTSSVSGFASYDLSTGKQITASTRINTPTRDVNENYVAIDLYMRESDTNILLADKIAGVSILSKPVETTNSIAVYGNDTVVAGGITTSSGQDNQIGGMIIIPNGNI